MEIKLNPVLQRAQLLVEHKRYAEAERELRQLLMQEPGHLLAQLMLTEALLEQEKVKEAEESVHAALSLEPGASIVHYTHARVLYAREKNRAAIEAVQQAIALDPDDAAYYGLLAAMQMQERQHEEALASAEKGLSFDPEHVLCLNIRSRMLFKLNRKQEAVQTIDKALEQDPSNAATHANYGWAWLEKNDPQQALEHFRTALQLDPNLDFAREGMKEALKGRYWVYRQYLKYAFWMGNQSSKQQWIFIIGLYVAFRVLRSVADTHEQLAPFLAPLLILYLLFAFSSWLMQPLGNLFLMLNTYGRYMLSEGERRTASYVGASLAVSVLGFAGWGITGLVGLMGLGVLGFSMMIPLGSMDRPSKPKNKRFLLVYTLMLLAVGLAAVSLALLRNDLGNPFTNIYLLGIILYQFVANAKVKD